MCSSSTTAYLISNATYRGDVARAADFCVDGLTGQAHQTAQRVKSCINVAVWSKRPTDIDLATEMLSGAGVAVREP